MVQNTKYTVEIIVDGFCDIQPGYQKKVKNINTYKYKTYWMSQKPSTLKTVIKYIFLHILHFDILND